MESEKGESSQISPVSKDDSYAESQMVVSNAIGTTDERKENAKEDYNEEAYMTLRERFDFLIIFLEFGVLVAGYVIPVAGAFLF